MIKKLSPKYYADVSGLFTDGEERNRIANALVGAFNNGFALGSFDGNTLVGALFACDVGQCREATPSIYECMFADTETRDCFNHMVETEKSIKNKTAYYVFAVVGEDKESLIKRFELSVKSVVIGDASFTDYGFTECDGFAYRAAKKQG